MEQDRTDNLMAEEFEETVSDEKKTKKKENSPKQTDTNSSVSVKLKCLCVMALLSPSR